MSKAIHNRPDLATVLRRMEAAANKAGCKERLESVLKSKKLFRKTFFKEASRAILVAGVNVEGARGWRKKAAKTGFPSDWKKLAN